MNTTDAKISEQEHAQTFQEKILVDANLASKTSLNHPKAVILGGQPGAGKGGLVETVRGELRNDAIVIDPDNLRDAHPHVTEFRRETPYTWSGRTHADASQWADELLDATVSAKKNLIFDTTLSNGQWTSELIKDLQSKGYEVEVRAIAAHRLESELGVDRRFTHKLDRDGFGRHVPEGARDAIYDKLPASLDTVHTQTDAPIRIFNREGVELYDSRTSTQLPGAALEQAREARLKGPVLTRALRDAWQEQQSWHQELPEKLPTHPKVDRATGENLLVERSANRVVERVDSTAAQALDVDHATRVRPTRIHAGKVLGIAGLALDAYDAADTLRTSNRLRGEGNDTAAASELIHFGSRTVGGFAGAGLGVTAGAIAGVETGPGLLVTGAIGGVVGVFAGDKIAQWTDDRRIYRQDDGQGNTWNYDPDQPDRGWRRTAPVDASDDRIDNPARSELRASPALANELNYKSTSISAELVLGGPPKQRDPFVQSANASDTPSITPASWTRDADSNEWRREVVIAFVERGMSPKRIETAGPERAAELDQAAANTVLHNAANSPPAIAARYEDAYARNGWAAHGPMPNAVTHARTNVDTLVASDDNRYQRRADGEWVSDGMIYDSTASGNLREELNATREVLRATLPPPQAVQAPPPTTPEARLRDTVMGAYANAGVSPSAERIEASATAVRTTWAANGLNPDTTALQLQPNADRRYDQDSPIASLRLDTDGKTYVIAAVTTPEEIQYAQTAKRGPTTTGDASEPSHDPSPAPRTTPATPSPANARHPSDPRAADHPDHRLYTQIEQGVHRIDAQLGRTPDAGSERLAMSAFVAAKAQGIDSADHVALSRQGTHHAAGSFVFVVQGQDPTDVRNAVARVSTVEALNQPLDRSLQQMDAMKQEQARSQTAAQETQSAAEHGRGQRMG
ncbi:zeta toxin family protein [Lysobacter sp. Root690]|uniref:zeta toxin family protein n=1 Tax=Lysobacter sp. Root690 TaxID=1736588 RepID=UPI000B1E4908|nr:zeta toxin family protein [Lysobacter sp. Root690]